MTTLVFDGSFSSDGIFLVAADTRTKALVTGSFVELRNAQSKGHTPLGSDEAEKGEGRREMECVCVCAPSFFRFPVSVDGILEVGHANNFS